MAAANTEDFQLTPEQLQQHPEAAALLLLAGLLMMLVLCGCLAAWTTSLFRWRAGLPVLKVEPWTPRVWGLADLLLVAMLVLVGQTVGLKLWANATGQNLRELAKADDFPLSAMAAGSLSYLAVMLLAIGWLSLRYRASLSHLGFNFRRLFSMLGVGIVAAVMWIPVVWVVMVLVSLGFDQKYDHPLLDRLNAAPSLSGYLLATFCAVAVAPIAEEFLFRVLLQGWLQSLPWSGRGMWWFTGASQEVRDAAVLLSDSIENQTQVDSELATDDNKPYAAPKLATANVALDPTNPPVVDPIEVGRGDKKPPIWPVFVSGTLFGLAHWGYGLSFVPLILLGIILGLLYRAKHSIWPSFAVHFTLNFISMLMLGVSLVVQAISK